MTTETIIATRTFRKEWQDAKTGRNVLIAVAKLYKWGDNARPHFTLTATHSDRYGTSGGCLHETVLRHFPELKIIADLHLSDDTGTPMHDVANGWYWMSGALGGAGEEDHGGNSNPQKTADECLKVWAEHMRVDAETARDVLGMLRLKVPAVSCAMSEKELRDMFDREFGPVIAPDQVWREKYTLEKLIEREKRMHWQPAKAAHLHWIAAQSERRQKEADAGLAFLKMA